MITFVLKTMFWKYSWTHFFVTEKLFVTCQTTRKLAFSEEVCTGPQMIPGLQMIPDRK